MSRIVRMLLLALFVASSLGAQEPPRFFIERIEVRKTERVSPDIIRAESRLREGQAYSEVELRDASHRLKRLHFVRDATFSLEKGSVRDTYVLVITISETRPLFYLLDVAPYSTDNVLVDLDNEALLGVRMFAGRSGVAHLAIVGYEDDRPFTSSAGALQAGYTRYGLFGGRAFATVTISRYFSVPQTRDAVAPGAVVGIALSPNQTLAISYATTEGGGRGDRTDRVAEARFTRNTTNDPFFPSDGALLSIAPVVAWTDGKALEAPLRIEHAFVTALEATAARYWPLSDRDSFAAVAHGGVARIEVKGDLRRNPTTSFGSALLRYSRALGTARPGDAPEHRIEFSLRAVSGQHDYTRLARDSSAQVSVHWVRRDAWGTLRLGAGYAW